MAAAVPSTIAVPGAVTLAYLQTGAIFISDQLSFIKGTPFDTPANDQAINNLAKGMNSLAATLEPLTEGATSVDVGALSGRALTMTAGDLAQADGMLVAALVAENNSVQNIAAAQIDAGVAPDFVIAAASSFGTAVSEVLDCAATSVDCGGAMGDLYLAAKQAVAANIIAIDVGGLGAMALVAGTAVLAGAAVPVGVLIAMGTALTAATVWALSGMIFNTPSQQEAATLGSAIGPAVNTLNGQLAALGGSGALTGAMGSVVDVLTGAQNAAAEEIKNSTMPTPTPTRTQTPTPTATSTPAGAACDGSYSGSYSGTAVTSAGSQSVSGGVAFSVSGKTINVSQPASGSGTLSGTGGSFGVSGGVSPGADCSFGGSFKCVAGGAASASGSWSCSFDGGSASGSWSASRN
ncbi:MAG TPA: hypothetical protein VMH37_09510 [Candidatus Binataceae bacterium]|nr:hypothetical protein [Candidatus Binataceae bacterium]